MPDANLYLERVDYEKYLSAHECKKCGAESCKALVAQLRAGGGYQSLGPLELGKAQALRAALSMGQTLPAVPSIPNPRPITPELAELNDPQPGDPVLVTGNSAFTQEVLLAVLSSTTSPFFVLFSDTNGDTLDMAVILKSFTAARLQRSCKALELAARAGSGALVLPGLAAALADDVAAATGFRVEVGPVCAAELPLYFGEQWASAAG